MANKMTYCIQDFCTSVSSALLGISYYLLLYRSQGRSIMGGQSTFTKLVIIQKVGIVA